MTAANVHYIAVDQLALFAPAERAQETGISHVCLPDFSLACGIGFLDKPDGDHVHYGRPARWADVTCDWCRSLGRGYCDHAVTEMQRRTA